MKKNIINHSSGYRLVYCPEHPSCQKDGYIYEHRFVIEKHLKRYLNGREVVHHINRIKNDNRLKNLLLCATERDHRRIHEGWIKQKDKWFKPCSGCKKFLEVNSENWYFRKTGKIVNICKKCSRKKAFEYKKTERYKQYNDKRNKRRNELRKINRKKINERVKKWRQKNKEEANRKAREWRKNNSEKIKKKEREWRQKNKEKLKKSNKRQRDRKKLMDKLK